MDIGYKKRKSLDQPTVMVRWKEVVNINQYQKILNELRTNVTHKEWELFDKQIGDTQAVGDRQSGVNQESRRTSKYYKWYLN